MRIEKALERAAASPSQPLDEKFVLRRGRQLRRRLIVTSALSIVAIIASLSLVAGMILATGNPFPQAGSDVMGKPEAAQPGPVESPTVEHLTPVYTVASGREARGTGTPQAWELKLQLAEFVYEDGSTEDGFCTDFVYGDDTGLSCIQVATKLGPDTFFVIQHEGTGGALGGDSAYAGIVPHETASVQITTESSQVDGEVHAPPDEFELPFKVFSAFVPDSGSVTVTAIDSGGVAIASDHVAGFSD